MRPIKFRAWDKVKEIFTNYQIVDGMLYFMDKYTGVWNRDDKEKRFILMQSTGLFDKNGVEIFEGDIVENTTQIVYLGDRFEVSWNGIYACFQLLNGGKSSNIPLEEDFMSYEIIGNIYENPELLEATDD